MPDALLTVVDRALPPALFTRLARAVRALGTERLRSTYQTPFWWPLDAEPTNLVELAIAKLATRVAPAAGAEWWLSRMRTSNVQVDFHQDRDEQLFLRTG